MRAAKVRASLRIRPVSPEPPLLAHTSSESRGTFRQKARSLAPLNGWTCAFEICHDGMLEDTNSLDAAYKTNGIRHICQQWLTVLRTTWYVIYKKQYYVFLNRGRKPILHYEISSEVITAHPLPHLHPRPPPPFLLKMDSFPCFKRHKSKQNIVISAINIPFVCNRGKQSIFYSNNYR